MSYFFYLSFLFLFFILFTFLKNPLLFLSPNSRVFLFLFPSSIFSFSQASLIPLLPRTILADLSFLLSFPSPHVLLVSFIASSTLLPRSSALLFLLVHFIFIYLTNTLFLPPLSPLPYYHLLLLLLQPHLSPPSSSSSSSLSFSLSSFSS